MNRRYQLSKEEIAAERKAFYERRDAKESERMDAIMRVRAESVRHKNAARRVWGHAPLPIPGEEEDDG